MNKNRRFRFIPVVLACGGLLFSGACTTNHYLSRESRSSGTLSDETVQKHSSGGSLQFVNARLITANDEAFLSKLDMVRSAERSIDAAYYIFSDDVTSSALAAELIAAAQRGVRVRLLLDYSSAYKDLDLFSMMQNEGSRGSGSLEVRFYNRPTRNIVMDAAFVTLGCGDLQIQPGTACSDAKLAEINAQFDAEVIDGRPASDLHISNLNIASSGIFLSGLYSKQPELMAFAIMHGREALPPSGDGGPSGISLEQIEGLVKLAKIYWASRTGGPFQRLVAKIQLAIISFMYGDFLDPLYEAVAQNLPIKRRNLREAVRDWEYVTDYLHQKLLLVDQTSMQLGGRNIEDTYHLTPSQAEGGIVFIDTDVQGILADGGASVQAAFERLWTFDAMVATVDEIRQHAPNALAANLAALRAAAESCESRGEGNSEDCFAAEFQTRAMSQSAREEERHNTMRGRADVFWNVFRPKMLAQSPTTITLDAGSVLFYVENIPFAGNPGGPLEGRTLGARYGREAQSGKRIHSLLLAGLEATCRTATAADPKRVIINNAYFFPPSNLVDMLARMLDGRLECRHVEVAILTNSRASSDLAITNLFARHIAFAFSDYVRSIRDPDKAANFKYYELQPSTGDIHRSLHSKVWVLGDDIIVGSANADVRSYMMDANNAVLIRRAPKLRRQYEAMFDSILADPELSKNRSAYYESTPREQVIEEDKATFRKILDSIDAGGKLTPEQRLEAESRFVGILDLIYRLTRNGLEGRLNSSDKRARFDRIFKLI